MELFQEDKYKDIKIDDSIIRALPFTVQEIDNGRVLLMLGFSSILPPKSTEEEVLAAMKRVIIDAKKIVDLVIKED